MSELYTQLREAGRDHERRLITAHLIDTMRLNPHGYEANVAYHGLCQAIVNRHRSGRGQTGISGNYKGVFPAEASAALVLTPGRVSGFLRAIHNARHAESALEAGPGASAIFSIAAARRGARVVAVEIDPMAAECAREIVELTGYKKRVEVKTGNILTEPGLPARVDMAIAEILGPGLRGENGPAVIAEISKRAGIVIPDAAIVYATDSPDDEGPWQELVAVDLTSPQPRVSGVFLSTSSGSRRIRVRADIVAQGEEIVAGLGTDDLTRPISIGGPIDIPSAGLPIEVSYDMGAAPYGTPDIVRLAS